MANIILEMQKEEMDEAIAHFEDSLKSVRTGMANANMLDPVLVDYYGSPTPVKQLAGISVQEGRTIVIKPYDSSSLKDEIENIEPKEDNTTNENKEKNNESSNVNSGIKFKFKIVEVIENIFD